MKKTFLTLLIPLLLVLFLTPASTSADTSLPRLGEASGGVLTPAEESELGRSLLREVRRSLPVVDDAEIRFYVESLGQQLASHSDGEGITFHFIPIDNDQVNAFAMPGGIIGVHTGLMLETRDEAELAAVMAHEIAHVTQRHLARMFARGREVNFRTGLAILAGVLAAGIDPQLGQAVITGGVAGGMQSRINFTRANEAEADRVGMRILAASDFDADAMADFFERMQELSRGAGDAVPEYLRTHPVTLNRITDARNRARDKPEGVRNQGPEFAWMQARARALSDPRRALDRIGEDASAAELYGGAIAQLERGNPREARQLLDRIDAPDAPTLTLELARIAVERATGEHEAALNSLEDLDTVYPGHPVVRERMARVQRDIGNYDRALRITSRMIRETEAPEPALLRLQANIASEAGREALRHETMAEYFFHRGQYEEAVRQFEVALEAGDASERDRQRIEDKRETASRTAREFREER